MKLNLTPTNVNTLQPWSDYIPSMYFLPGTQYLTVPLGFESLLLAFQVKFGPQVRKCLNFQNEIKSVKMLNGM